MRIYEIANAQVAALTPTVVRQQQHVAGVVKQIAASEKKHKATEMDKVQAMRVRATQQKQADRDYERALRKQLALAATKS